MDFWIFVAFCVAAGVISEMYRARLKAKVQMAETDNHVGGLEQQLRKIEERLNNLETIVIERDRHKEFDRAL